jgi:ribonuclease PH
MGANCTDYLREAHRTLALSGSLLIAETASRVDDMQAFAEALIHLGFDVANTDRRDRFVFITALRADRVPRPDARLPL